MCVCVCVWHRRSVLKKMLFCGTRGQTNITNDDSKHMKRMDASCSLFWVCMNLTGLTCHWPAIPRFRRYDCVLGLATLSRWAIRAAMTMGTAMPRLLAATGGLGLMVKGCSEEEGLMFGSETTAEVSLGAFLVALVHDRVTLQRLHSWSQWGWDFLGGFRSIRKVTERLASLTRSVTAVLLRAWQSTRLRCFLRSKTASLKLVLP